MPKIKMKMKKLEKMNSIFQFLYQTRLYGNFHENLSEKKFNIFCRTFLTNQGKNEDENEKMWENESNF